MSSGLATQERCYLGGSSRNDVDAIGCGALIRVKSSPNFCPARPEPKKGSQERDHHGGSARRLSFAAGARHRTAPARSLAARSCVGTLEAMAGWQTRRAPPITAYRQRELSAEQASGEGSNKEGAEKEAEEGEEDGWVEQPNDRDKFSRELARQLAESQKEFLR